MNALMGAMLALDGAMKDYAGANNAIMVLHVLMMALDGILVGQHGRYKSVTCVR